MRRTGQLINHLATVCISDIIQDILSHFRIFRSVQLQSGNMTRNDREKAFQTVPELRNSTS